MPSRCRKQPIVAILAAALSAAAAAPATVRAPVGITRAQAAALAKAPGQLVDTTLALDRGRLVYGVEVATGPTTLTNVEVDARSGRVLGATSHLDPGPASHEVEAP